MVLGTVFKWYEAKYCRHLRIVQLGNVMDTDKLSPSRTSLACLEHARIHTVCISCMFSYSASLMSVEISLCSVPQENEPSAGFTLYQQFIHRSILFTSLSLSYFFFTDLSPSIPLSVLCQVRKCLCLTEVKLPCLRGQDYTALVQNSVISAVFRTRDFDGILKWSVMPHVCCSKASCLHAENNEFGFCYFLD